jgi:hypothetical protein
MRAFRNTTLHHLIEETTNYSYKIPGSHGGRGRSRRDQNNRFSRDGSNNSSRTGSNNLDGSNYTMQRTGTINLVRNYLNKKL